MESTAILENRRYVGLKLCRQIRQNNFQMINAKNFSERPYLDGEKKQKFNTTNYLRLLASERNYSDPRWYSETDIQRKNLTLKENAMPELLETNSANEYYLQKFYNAVDINEVEKLETENQTLEEVLDFLIVRDILETDGEIISLQDGIDAVKNYAAKNFQDELVQILTVQMWLAETKLKTKMALFLPTYSEEVLIAIEKNPEIIFQKIQLANDILKKLKMERVKPIAEEVKLYDLFQGLKIIYHSSEIEIEDNQGLVYPAETILTGVSAYEFLSAWKRQEENFKMWLKFSYKDYDHGKFLLLNSSDENFIADVLKKRLEKNRRELLKNPQNLPTFILNGTEIPTKKIIEKIEKESAAFLKIITDFEIEEKKYFEIYSVN